MGTQTSCFSISIRIGPDACAFFQLLQNGMWDKTFYPHVANKSTLEEHKIRGPDGCGHDMNWQIGKFAEEGVKAGANCCIEVALGSVGALEHVTWKTCK